MKVTTIAASVRFSKAIGGGQHKTIELSAEAAIDGKEAWAEAQASLYHDLGQQLKALWPTSGQAISGAQARNNGSHADTPAHYCHEHKTEYKRYGKSGKVWYSHKSSDGKWCREK
jgi:hypothetical protein